MVETPVVVWDMSMIGVHFLPCCHLGLSSGEVWMGFNLSGAALLVASSWCCEPPSLIRSSCSNFTLRALYYQYLTVYSVWLWHFHWMSKFWNFYLNPGDDVWGSGPSASNLLVFLLVTSLFQGVSPLSSTSLLVVLSKTSLMCSVFSCNSPAPRFWVSENSFLQYLLCFFP